MTERRDHRTDTSPEDQALLDGARRLLPVLRHPLAIGVIAVAAAALLFRLGISIGESLYLAFDGDGTMAAVFGATLVTILAGIIAIGAWLDRRQRSRDAQAGPLTHEQRERLHAYLHPATPLVRWYLPAAVALFIVLAAVGDRLLDAPWDALWVIAALAANPVGRWLRAKGHVLTTRDLGFAIPGLSPWPSIATAAVAATAGMAIAVLLWAEALDTALATTLSGIAIALVIIGGGLVADRHERRHISTLLG